MKTLTKTALVAVSIAALGCLSTAAYAADPATLPTADAMYQGNYNEQPAALWTTASDGTATVIGTPATLDLSDVTDGAWNPVTGASYVVGNGYDGPCELWLADVSTGQYTYIADITDAGGGGETNDCDAFDIAPDGTAWITMYDGDTLAKLNLADGTTSAAIPMTGLTNGASWIVVQPTTGVVYLGDWNDNVFTLDTTTGVATPFAQANEEHSIYDAAFDSAGRLWLTEWPDNTALLSADIADYANTLVTQGNIEIDGSGDATGTDSLWIVRGAAVEPVKPALAETGVDMTFPLVAGLGMLLLGAGVIGARRMRRA